MARLVSRISDGGEPFSHADIVFLCTHGMSLLSLSLSIEALRITNRVMNLQRFKWQLVTSDGGPITASGDIEVHPDAAISEVEQPRLCIVLASYEIEAACTPAVSRQLRLWDAQGVALGCVDCGAYVLAQAGVLGNARIAVHHEAAGPFKERWPQNIDTDRPFIIDQNRISSGGGVDTIDMTLAVVAREVGDAVADQTAAIMRYQRHREPSEFSWSVGRLGTAHLSDTLAACIRLMGEHIEDPIGIPAVCACLDVPEWQLRRVFKQHLGTTPSSYYMRLRLDRAQQLLRFSDLPVAEVAAACGFKDGATFSHAYRRYRDRSPSQERAIGTLDSTAKSPV